jgi:HK97 family phage major capsid protein
MDPDINELMSKFDANHAAVLSQFRNASEKIGALQNEINQTQARLTAAEQEIVRKGSGSGVPHVETFGSIVTRHSEFAAIAALANRRGKHTLNVKAMITSLPDSGGALVAPDVRTDPVMLARRRLTVRNLIGPGTTISNLVEFPRQTLRDLQADVVTEGELKPESNLEFEIVDAPVRTIAHWIKTSKQILADAAQLRTTIDGELRYGIGLAEETQFLFGDGLGQNLYGIVPQASAFDGSFLSHTEAPQRFDYIKAAITQSEVALLPATGVVMNDRDLGQLAMVKDANGNYLAGAAGGPFGPRPTQIWGLTAVGTPVMPQDHFLVGAFADGAQVFDRETVDVVVATENEDDFVKNKATVLCEERLAFAVKRPQAFVFGAFSLST